MLDPRNSLDDSNRLRAASNFLGILNDIKRRPEDAAKELDNFDFHIFGGLKSDIERYTSQSLNDNIYFHGFKQQNELPFLRSKCDILLMPYQKQVSIGIELVDTSRWMSPMKMFEYMSSSVPIISSNLPVLREVLVDNKNSILVEPDSLSEWSNALDMLLDSADLSKRISENSYNDYLNNYTWNIRAQGILDLFP